MRWPWDRERSELDREVAYHIETLADAYETEGMSRAEALVRARREFGGVEHFKEQCRDGSRWNWAGELFRDLQFGWRMMGKSPGASFAAVASLALGIGATTALFSLAHNLLWRKIAAPQPEQLVEIFWESKASFEEGLYRGASGNSFQDGPLIVADFFSKTAFESMRERTKGKIEIAAHLYPDSVSVSTGDAVAVAHLRGVSENFFPVLGIQPALGRLLDGRGTERVIVVSHRFWERHLGSQATAIGQTIRVNNLAYAVSGVLPREFEGLAPGDNVDLYTMIAESPALLTAGSFYHDKADDPYVWWLQLLGRKSPATPPADARAMLDAAFAASWPTQPKKAESVPRIRLTDASTGLGEVRREMGNPVTILLIMVAMVLVVACSNIANLLLARATEREKEAALRVTLGCGSARLMRQFFTESLLLAILGGVCSAGIAYTIAGLLATLLPQGFNADSMQLVLNPLTLTVTAGVTILTALLFGLYPAWRASRVDAAPAIKEGVGSAGTTSRRRWAPAKAFVIAQVAIGVLLVMAAFLYTGSLSEIINRDAGFDRSRILMFDLRPGELGYSGSRLTAFYSAIEERLRAIPGVSAVGLSQIRPMRGGGRHEFFKQRPDEKGVPAGVHLASADFMTALGVPIIAGRGLTPEDLRTGRNVAVISEDLARDLKYSPAVGARIHNSRTAFEIIGVARKARYSSLARTMPVIYLPMQADTRSVTVVIRNHVSPLSLLPAAKDAVRTLDRSMPLVDIFTMEQQISRTLQRERLFAWLCGGFGILALVLCVVGMYGLMSHTAARRVPEIGIRMALGAPAREALRRVVSEGLILAWTGIALGAPAAIYLAEFAKKQRVLPAEGGVPYWTLVAAIGVLVAATVAAVLGPAIRASRVDPMRVLRQG